MERDYSSDLQMGALETHLYRDSHSLSSKDLVYTQHSEAENVACGPDILHMNQVSTTSQTAALTQP